MGHYRVISGVKYAILEDIRLIARTVGARARNPQRGKLPVGIDKAEDRAEKNPRGLGRSDRQARKERKKRTDAVTLLWKAHMKRQ